MVETQTPDIKITVGTLGTAKRKEGEGFEPLLNLTCEVLHPDQAKVGWLYEAAATGRAVHLDATDIVTVSTVRAKRKSGDDEEGGVSVTFVARRPSHEAVLRFYKVMERSEILHVEAAQLGFGESVSGPRPDEDHEDDEDSPADTDTPAAIAEAVNAAKGDPRVAEAKRRTDEANGLNGPVFDPSEPINGKVPGSAAEAQKLTAAEQAKEARRRAAEEGEPVSTNARKRK